jgi:hypothetical protein
VLEDGAEHRLGRFVAGVGELAFGLAGVGSQKLDGRVLRTMVSGSGAADDWIE